MHAALILKALHTRNPEDVRCYADESFNDSGVGALMGQLLLAPWHRMHEDMVFNFASIALPEMVPAIFQAANTRFDYMVQGQSQRAFERKCAYTLAAIGTTGARLALEELAGSADPILRQYGREGLRHW
ncbi:hypothetical protein [Massilia aquatica]|uniref:Uncharacterized protein n=1 Tax=Massilia aquatica TaxID=2609000 RepID=A0ABX0M1W8_9BURK|nr:hypothetical protein [Massilia aquatica]NHZ41144.1 hypothetical protein [Massilia aquatica]